MSKHVWWAAPLLLLAAVVACGGSETASPGQTGAVRLTDPREAPTATPWTTPPPVTYLEGTPVAGSGTPAPGGPCGEEYVVQPGDIPLQIAQRCGVTLEELLAANPGLDPTRLRPGDRLKIPRR